MGLVGHGSCESCVTTNAHVIVIAVCATFKIITLDIFVCMKRHNLLVEQRFFAPRTILNSVIVVCFVPAIRLLSAFEDTDCDLRHIFS